MDNDIVADLLSDPLSDTLNAEKNEIKSDVEALKNRIGLWNKNCRDLLIPLTSIEFECDEEEMKIVLDEDYYDKPLFFKVDPTNPKDPKVLHAHKQFCKMIGVPYSFFAANRPSLKNNIVRTWQSSLEADKANCVARIRESDDHAIIRALLPDTSVPFTNEELLDIIKESVRIPLTLEFSHGDERDDLSLHARFLSNQIFQIKGEDVCLGFSLLSSELGSSPLIVEVILHHIQSKSSVVATYGNGPFFKSKYEGIQKNDLKEMFPLMIERIENEAAEFVTRIASEDSRSVFPKEDCYEVSTMKKVPKKFVKALYQEVAEHEDDMRTPWDFARHMALIAKDFDPEKRIDVERIAGKYLNLVFTRN